HLPEPVRVVALSATVSNAEEFGDWLTQVRGGTTVIVDEHRPVPLWQHVLADGHIYHLFLTDGTAAAVGRAQGARAAGPRRPARAPFLPAGQAGDHRAAGRRRAAARHHVHL